MPIYEYICLDCETEHEAIQKVSDEPLQVCPQCNENNLRKKASQTSFQLKGGGWYKDGYGGGAAKPAAASK